MIFLSKSSVITKKTASLLAKEILKTKNRFKGAFTIGLIGNLGSGKTTFIQGFIKAAGIKKRITSPTFLIIKNYRLKRTKKYQSIYHIDAYRIKKINELRSLNFSEIINNPKNIILIEWADKIKKIMPANSLWLKFKHVKQEKERIIEINS